jgi:hypothetical protein
VQRSSFFGVLAAFAAVAFVVPGSDAAQPAAKPIPIAASAIGRPPIFSNTFADVAEAMGYFKDAGVDVTFRWFQRGSDTAKAVVTGDVAVGFTASQPALNLISGGADIVAIAGMPNQDWIIATDRGVNCALGRVTGVTQLDGATPSPPADVGGQVALAHTPVVAIIPLDAGSRAINMGPQLMRLHYTVDSAKAQLNRTQGHGSALAKADSRNHTIFEGTSEIQQLVIARAISGLRIE